MDKSLPDTCFEEQLAELKQKIVAHEKSNQFFEMLVRSLPGLFYLFDSNFNVLKWNRNLELVTGYSREEIPTRNLFDLFDGKDLVKVKKVVEDVLDGHQGEVEAELITKTGERRPYHFTGYGATIDNESYLVGVGMDLSVYKKTLKELQESEALYRLLAERMTEGVVLLKNFKILFANNAFLRIFGYTDAGSLIGGDLREMIANGFEIYFQDLCDALENGICRERFFQARWLNTDKDELWVEGIGNSLEWKG